MLFDERPKSRREDLYDRARELNDILNNIDKPMIVVTGIRRIGKTSVINVALNEVGLPYVLIDCRSLRDNYGRPDLYRLISNALSSSLDKLVDVLRRIRGISIMGNTVEIRWRGREQVSLAELFDRLNERRVVVAFDEAQRLRGPLSGEVLNALAHAYDFDRNVTFILTGSEVGLLYDFIGVEDPNSPLFGRYFYEVRIDRFNRDESMDFLTKGFMEFGVDVPRSVIEEIVDVFDGIPGWLVYAANSYLRGVRDLAMIREAAIREAMNELERFVRIRANYSVINAKRTVLVLRCIANGSNTWSKVARCVEDLEGVSVSPTSLSNILNTLERLSIIRDYQFLDPMYREAAIRLTMPFNEV
ncbi:MAG: AAA family ATPase [Vulcanisaeta sp.]